MAISFNSNIVRDGLVLHLDAANPKSYPGSGTVWTDMSGNGNNGQISGAVNFVSNGPKSYFNWATASDTSFIYSTTPQDYQDIFIWFNPDFTRIGAASIAGLVSTGAPNTDKSLRFTNVNGTGPWTLNGRNPGDLNDWAFGSATTYRINGEVSQTLSAGWNSLSGYRTNRTNFASNNIWNYYLGSSGYTGRGFQGRIGLIMMYNRALSAQEVKQNFEATRGRYGV